MTRLCEKPGTAEAIRNTKASPNRWLNNVEISGNWRVNSDHDSTLILWERLQFHYNTTNSLCTSAKVGAASRNCNSPHNWQVKLAASSMLPVPLYLGLAG